MSVRSGSNAATQLAAAGVRSSRPLLLGAELFSEQPGGLNRYFRDLQRSLSTVGAPITGVVVGGSSAEPPPGYELIPPGALPVRLWRYAAAVRRQRSSADVVDSHFALYGIAALIAGADRGRPFVVHFHGPWADEGKSVGERSALKRAARRLIERIVYRRAAVTVTLSTVFKRLLVERYGVGPWTIEVVPPAVDLVRFAPGDAGRARRIASLPASGWIVVAVRRLVPRMGLDNLLRAWALLDLGTDAKLVLVGDGPERMRLERLAGELGVAETVQFRGRIEDPELVACYQAADVSVVPSTELEGFGLSVLESLACGTPVITSDVGGLPEATAGMPDRLTFPADDPERLAQTLGSVLAGKHPVPGPEACRAHAERFSPEALAERHRAVFRRAISPSTDLRVVYLDHCARLSGAEVGMLRIITSLSGVEAHVILGEEGPLELRLRESGISTEVLPLDPAARELSRHRARPSLAAARASALTGVYVARLARRLAKLKPDLVHANSLKSGLYGAPASRLARRPLVWHLHDRLAADYMPAHAARLIRLAIGRLADQVIVNSEATRATLGERVLGEATVIPCPIELPASPAVVRAKVRRVGIVGRLSSWKGQHVFLDAFARAFPGNEVEAVVVGAPLFGEESYAAGLRSQARDLGIEQRVTFRGFVDDVFAELDRLDVLVHASVIPEPFGQVVVEGMSVGLPVVAPKAGGPAEIIHDRVDGLLYPPADVAGLADCLRLLAEDQALRGRLGAAGRARAADFAPAIVAERVSRVYDRASRRPERTM